MTTVAVCGASGFTGTAVVERLLRERPGIRIKAFYNSAKSVWRLARLNVPLHRLDVLDKARAREALSDCTHVVNCVMGSRAAMLQGTANLLEASVAAKVSRFVHLSSITVYGEPPAADAVSEQAKPRPIRGTYGWIKLRQDEMVQRAAAKGLSATILCPPVVTGPYSTVLGYFMQAAARGQFAEVDGGSSPLAVVDVRNLAKAVDLALLLEEGIPERIFVLDEENVTWADLLCGLSPILEQYGRLPQLTRSQALAALEEPDVPPISLRGTLRRLTSPEMRAVLSSDPLYIRVRAMLRKVRWAVRKTPSRPGRLLVKSQESVSPPAPKYDKLFLSRQLRGVCHRLDKARATLGYEADLSFATSTRDYVDWWKAIHGGNSPFSDLLRELTATNKN